MILDRADCPFRFFTAPDELGGETLDLRAGALVDFVQRCFGKLTGVVGAVSGCTRRFGLGGGFVHEGVGPPALRLRSLCPLFGLETGVFGGAGLADCSGFSGQSRVPFLKRPCNRCVCGVHVDLGLCQGRFGVCSSLFGDGPCFAICGCALRDVGKPDVRAVGRLSRLLDFGFGKLQATQRSVGLRLHFRDPRGGESGAFFGLLARFFGFTGAGFGPVRSIGVFAADLVGGVAFLLHRSDSSASCIGFAAGPSGICPCFRQGLIGAFSGGTGDSGVFFGVAGFRARPLGFYGRIFGRCQGPVAAKAGRFDGCFGPSAVFFGSCDGCRGFFGQLPCCGFPLLGVCEAPAGILAGVRGGFHLSSDGTELCPGAVQLRSELDPSGVGGLCGSFRSFCSLTGFSRHIAGVGALGFGGLGTGFCLSSTVLGSIAGGVRFLGRLLGERDADTDLLGFGSCAREGVLELVEARAQLGQLGHESRNPASGRAGALFGVFERRLGRVELGGPGPFALLGIVGLGASGLHLPLEVATGRDFFCVPCLKLHQRLFGLPTRLQGLLGPMLCRSGLLVGLFACGFGGASPLRGVVRSGVRFVALPDRRIPLDLRGLEHCFELCNPTAGRFLVCCEPHPCLFGLGGCDSCRRGPRFGLLAGALEGLQLPTKRRNDTPLPIEGGAGGFELVVGTGQLAADPGELGFGNLQSADGLAGFRFRRFAFVEQGFDLLLEGAALGLHQLDLPLGSRRAFIGETSVLAGLERFSFGSLGGETRALGSRLCGFGCCERRPHRLLGQLHLLDGVGFLLFELRGAGLGFAGGLEGEGEVGARFFRFGAKGGDVGFKSGHDVMVVFELRAGFATLGAGGPAAGLGGLDAVAQRRDLGPGGGGLMEGGFGFLSHGVERQTGAFRNRAGRLRVYAGFGSGLTGSLELFFEVLVCGARLFQLAANPRQLGFGGLQPSPCASNVVPGIVEGVHPVFPCGGWRRTRKGASEAEPPA